MKKIYITLLCLSLTGLSYAQQKTAKAPQVKQNVSFGVVLNEDGDHAFVTPDPVAAEKMLRANVDGCARLGIKTYVFCIGAGSDVLYYPTKVASTVGWRKTKYEDENPIWKYRIESARACIAAGLDAVNIAGTQAKKNGMLYLPSLRMNDSHFFQDPQNYPLTGQFWLNNTDLTIKDSPVVFSKDYGNLFDYTHQKVRDFRYAVFNEVLERNKNIIDGFELDFNRTQIFFPKGKADAGAPLMTELVRKVRQRLNQLAKEQGRPMYLFVRIPPSEEACKWAGLDVDTWMKEGLVDLISPSQLMTIPHDMPIEALTKKANKYGVKMYPSMYPRTSWRVPLDPSANNLGMETAINRDVTLAEALGAADNYRWMGADGFYLFNYYAYPQPAYMYEMVAAFGANTPNDNDKVFAITKTYYNDDKEPSYAYVKQLPKQVKDKQEFKLLVGENIQAKVFPIKTCVLRLGVKKYSGDANNIKVKLNGNVLPLKGEKDHLASGKKLQADMADKSLIYTIDNLKYVAQGNNKVEVEVNGALVTDIEIAYSEYNDISQIMRGIKAPALNQNISLK